MRRLPDHSRCGDRTDRWSADSAPHDVPIPRRRDRVPAGAIYQPGCTSGPPNGWLVALSRLARSHPRTSSRRVCRHRKSRSGGRRSYGLGSTGAVASSSPPTPGFTPSVAGQQPTAIGVESRGAKGRFRVGPILEKELRPRNFMDTNSRGRFVVLSRGSQSAGRQAEVRQGAGREPNPSIFATRLPVCRSKYPATAPPPTASPPRRRISRSD